MLKPHLLNLKILDVLSTHVLLGQHLLCVEDLPAAPGTRVLGPVLTPDRGQVRGHQRPPLRDHASVGVAAVGTLHEAAHAVALGAEDLGVAALAVDLAVGGVVAEDRVQGALALAAGEAFLRQKAKLRKISWYLISRMLLKCSRHYHLFILNDINISYRVDIFSGYS